jgi:hypothetical protein
MIVAYTDENGAPVLSFRGSTQLSIWVRHASGGMIKALQHNPNMALMYRDPHSRPTDIDRVTGNTPRGGARMRRQATS